MGFGLVFVAFAASRWAVFELFSGPVEPATAAGPLAMLVVAWLSTAIGLPVIANARLAPMHRWTAVLLAVVLPLSVLAAYLAIQVFPAVNGATNLIQAPPWLFGVRPEYWY